MALDCHTFGAAFTHQATDFSFSGKSGMFKET